VAIKFYDLHVPDWGCLFLLEGLLHLAYWCQNGQFLRTISRHTVIDTLCDSG